LNGFIRLGKRPEHPIGDRSEVRAVGLEALGEPVLIVHGHIPFAATVMEMTDEGGPM
jgi:hypothetical protein